MKTLRLFIGHDLTAQLNWVLINEDGSHETGNSVINEIAAFDHIALEVYLSVSCYSIFKTNIHGISTKRLTEELVLGLIEDNIVDDIDAVKPIILHTQDTEQDTVYVAVFNREYYDTLISTITGLNKPIRFIQSFAFATILHDDAWTVFLGKTDRFVRTSKFEAYTLDSNNPVPALLVDMLNQHKPQELLIYAEDKTYTSINDSLAVPLNIKCTNITEQFAYGVPVWNFYNPKSTSFKIKLDSNAKDSLWRLLKLVKYLGIFLFICWVFSVIQLNVTNYRLKQQIKTNLSKIVNTKEINDNLLQTATDEITQMRHQRGVYDSTDAIVLLNKFLEVVSTINHDDIKQIKFTQGALKIILSSRFDTANFTNYANILATRHVSADITDYKSYAKALKSSNSNNNSLLNQDDKLIDDAAWVVTLQPELINQTAVDNSDKP